jgi:uncharacterized protein
MTPIVRGAVLVVAAYQRLLSPFLGPHCRFAPTCSEYARQTLLGHGALRGAWLALQRILKCQPFHPGGYDPPPAPRAG